MYPSNVRCERSFACYHRSDYHNGPVAQLVRAPPCHGGGREFESHLGRLRGLSSAGRASALQAEGHRFEPYRPHFFNLICRSGGTGRRPGLKIPWVVIPVPVRFRSAARFKRLQILCFREFGVFFIQHLHKL